MKKITNKKIFFDPEGNLFFPRNIKFWWELKPPLSLKEWWFLVFKMADKSLLSEEKRKRKEESFKEFFGSKTTIYRIKKSLKEKGYL